MESSWAFQARSRSRSTCWSGTADTSPSHARSGVFFAPVINAWDNSALLGTRT
ncbi:hypothetical protein [Nocardiopsis kunsanensis]|uniref:hypothetical protein n=1 Tax=Nocardiopsis kunsanensis TaxID=141693 RepID=UPI0030840CBA